MHVPFSREGEALIVRLNGETVRIEPWGPDALRVRSRVGGEITEYDWSALLPPAGSAPKIEVGERAARIENGAIAAELAIVNRHAADVKTEATIRFVRTADGSELLAETRPHFAGPPPRAFKAVGGEAWQLDASFRAYDGERLFGLGQPQHGRLDLKGVSTRLLQQNTHVAIPFALSSRGYGFLWHNPAVGRVDFSANLTRWSAEASRQLDYWIVAGDTPAEIVRRFMDATGHAPDFPDWASGFWQCKLRYRTQDELVSVARAYKERGLPLSCIVIDFFNWTRQGEWRFDPAEWPDPDAMMRELESLGVKTMVSIWPTVSPNAVNYAEMRERGLLIRTERGVPAVIHYPDKNPMHVGFSAYYDAFNPEARAFVWDCVKTNYLAHGIGNYWLDACEPEMRPNHAENVRTFAGNGAEVLNAYPLMHQRGFRAGMTEAGLGDEEVLLCRSSWVGSQRHGVILWSGDVWSNWDDFRAQIPAGLHAGLSGLAWWTTDIGGFHEGCGRDPDFRELLVRWFQFGVYSPICRLHGFRVPDSAPWPPEPGAPVYGADTFTFFTTTGGDNEVWSFGEEVYAILKDLLAERERLRPAIQAAMKRHKETGDPVMRPLFYDFPDDATAWTVDDQYLFTDDLLVAPVLSPGARSRGVWLPAGASWRDEATGTVHEGGQRIEADAPLARCPVFRRV